MEVWKDIKGFEGLYRISTTGKVYSVRRHVIMKPKTDRYGYYVIGLWGKEKKYFTTIHRLVAETFLGKPNGCDVVNHLDCDKRNNNVSNLEWTTVQQNTKHAYDNIKKYHDHVQRMNKLGIEARKIKLDAYYNGEYIGSYNGKKEAADSLGISEKTVYNRLHGRFTSRSGYTFVKKVVR